MPLSPALAHRQRKLATARGEDDAPPAVGYALYQQMLARLAADKRTLHAIRSTERKIEKKRQLLPDYRPWVEGVLAGGAASRDDVFMTMLVWTIDVGDLDAALPLLRFALAHDLPMPDSYRRDVATFAAEQAAEQALADLAQKKPVDPAPLIAIADATAGRDMPDEVRAKILKALGMAEIETDAGAALAALRRALALNPKIGVKKEIERLERIAAL